jgi:hypothetical protein
MKTLIGKTIISIGLAAATAPAAAQYAPANPIENSQSQTATETRHTTRIQHDKRPFTLPTVRVEARLAYIKTALKISEAQMPQWEAFANMLRTQATEREKRMTEWQARMNNEAGDHGRRQLSVIERMEREQQFHAAGIRKLNEQLTVERPLYAVLTREQKQIADEVLAPNNLSRHSHGDRGKHHQA